MRHQTLVLTIEQAECGEIIGIVVGAGEVVKIAGQAGVQWIARTVDDACLGKQHFDQAKAQKVGQCLVNNPEGVTVDFVQLCKIPLGQLAACLTVELRKAAGVSARTGAMFQLRDEIADVIEFAGAGDLWMTGQDLFNKCAARAQHADDKDRFLTVDRAMFQGGHCLQIEEINQCIADGDESRACELAQRGLDQGAQWLHVVNLDGAFAESNDNGSILERIARLGVPVQFGGGLRSLDDIERALNRGATRVVLGTVAIRNPEIVLQALATWGPEAICVGLDARDGKVATHGWQQVTDVTPVELGKTMAESGVHHALFTDVSRDGQLSGVNLDATVALGRATGLQVIASGGLSSIPEIEYLRNSQAVAGAIIGMALYEGKIALEAALQAAGGTHADETNHSLS